MRSPFLCLLLNPPKFFNKCFHDSVYFNGPAQRRAAVNQCFCLKKKKLSNISDSCDTAAETVRPIETYKITLFVCVFNFPQMKTDI